MLWIRGLSLSLQAFCLAAKKVFFLLRWCINSEQPASYMDRKSLTHADRKPQTHTHTTLHFYDPIMYLKHCSIPRLMQLSLLVPRLSLTEKSYRLCQKCWITAFFNFFSTFGVIELFLKMEGLDNCGLRLHCGFSHRPATQQWRFSLQRHRVATKTPKWLLVRPGGRLTPRLNTQFKPHC